MFGLLTLQYHTLHLHINLNWKSLVPEWFLEATLKFAYILKQVFISVHHDTESRDSTHLTGGTICMQPVHMCIFLILFNPFEGCSFLRKSTSLSKCNSDNLSAQSPESYI